MSMYWLELSIDVPPQQVETAYAALAELAPGGCSIEDAVTLLGPEEGFRRDPARPSVLRLYLPIDGEIEQRRVAAFAATAALPFDAAVSERQMREEDWANGWKEHFHVEHVGSRLVVRPTWREYAAKPDEVVLDLDPGMAFGTGQHETTRLCMAAIEQVVTAGMAVLDLGSGSGILAVAAARLGAAAVTAVDIESVAVEATAENVRRNGVAHVVGVGEGSLDGRWPFGALPVDRYDVVVANIHATAVIALSPAMHRALHRTGTLIASGIIAARLGPVRAALRRAGFAITDERQDGEWRAVLATPAPVR